MLMNWLPMKHLNSSAFEVIRILFHKTAVFVGSRQWGSSLGFGTKPKSVMKHNYTPVQRKDKDKHYKVDYAFFILQLTS